MTLPIVPLQKGLAITCANDILKQCALGFTAFCFLAVFNIDSDNKCEVHMVQSPYGISHGGHIANASDLLSV